MNLNAWCLQPHLDESFPLPLDRPFTWRMAQAAGVPRGWLRRLVAEGLLRHPIRGCYVASQAPDNPRTRAECLRLVAPPDAVIVDRHAGWLQGADMLLLPNEHLQAMPVTMYLPAKAGRRLRSQLAASGERTFLPGDITDFHGLQVTTPLRTALDLGRQRWPEAALTALDALHRLGTFSVAELVAEIPRFAGMRWVTTLRRVAPYVDGRSMSGGETVVRWRWSLMADLPPPEPQVHVRLGSREAFVDVGNEERLAGIEVQSKAWHSAHDQRESDAARLRWLREDMGWVIEELWPEDIYGHQARVESVIMSVLRQARERDRRTA